MNKQRTKLGVNKLGVNIDHVATLRRLRDTPYPNLLKAAQEVIAGGADQITVHLREDRRHIVDSDVLELKKQISVDLNFEMAATEAMLEFALKVKPSSICIVPEKREERTTEGGLNLSGEQRRAVLDHITKRARSQGILVSYFIEPDPQDVKTSIELGAQAVELHTGSLCLAIQNCASPQEIEHQWQRVEQSAQYGAKAGILVHAGHGIDYAIASELVRRVPEIVEYNIGHAIVCEAVFDGLRAATKRMKDALRPIRES